MSNDKTRKPMQRLNLTISGDEWLALFQSAERNLRAPKMEARHILRQVLLGLSDDPVQSEPAGYTVQLADIDGKQTGFADTWMTSVPRPGDTVYTEYDGKDKQWEVKSVDWWISAHGDVTAGLRMKEVTA